MKKFLSILAILAAVVLAPSCQKELPDAIKNVEVNKGDQSPASPEISLDMNNMEFTAESGSKAFNIKSNTSWTVSSDKTWCSVSPASGKNSGSVTVKVSENTQTSARTATVTVKSEIGILTVKVTQNEASQGDSEEAPNQSLEGSWKGNMHISAYYGGRSYNSIYTEITFIGDPYSLSRGDGCWVDYYSDAPWDYIANHIMWEVNNRVIYIYFQEEDTRMRISDYRLKDDRFYGTLSDNGNYIDFELYRISSPNWTDYRWGFDPWIND